MAVYVQIAYSALCEFRLRDMSWQTLHAGRPVSFRRLFNCGVVSASCLLWLDHGSACIRHANCVPFLPLTNRQIRRVLGKDLKQAQAIHAPLVTTLLQLELAKVAETDAERIRLLASAKANAESLGI